MKFAELESRNQGVPDIYAGYDYVKIDEITGEWTFSQEVPCAIKRKAQYTIDSEGHKVPKMSQRNNPIEDRSLFLPIIYNGRKIVTATKSPILIRMFANIETAQQLDFRGANLDVLSEKIEGTFVFVKEDYEYTRTKVVPVWAISEIESE